MKYEYTGELIVDFPTLGLRDVKKGDTFESDIEINNQFINKLEEPQDIIADEIKTEEEKLAELKSEELKGVE